MMSDYQIECLKDVKIFGRKSSDGLINMIEYDDYYTISQMTI